MRGPLNRGPLTIPMNTHLSILVGFVGGKPLKQQRSGFVGEQNIGMSKLKGSLTEKAPTARVKDLEGTKGVPRKGDRSNSWFDCVLLSILYMFEPSC